MKRKKILVKEVYDDNGDYSFDYIFDDDGLYGADGKNGLIITGNNSFKGMFYCEDRVKDMIHNFLEWNSFDVDAICDMLSRKLGKEYVCREISGCSQGDYNYAFYPKKEFNDDYLDIIEAAYFNTGRYFEFVDENGDYIDTLYTTAYSDSKIKEEIKGMGYKLKDVIVRVLDGYISIHKYKTI